MWKSIHWPTHLLEKPVLKVSQHLQVLAWHYLPTSAACKPCECLYSAAGGVVARNCLSLNRWMHNNLFQDDVFTVNSDWVGQWFTPKCMLHSSSFRYLVLLVFCLLVMPCRSKLFSICHWDAALLRINLMCSLLPSLILQLIKGTLNCNVYFFPVSLGEVKTGSWPWKIPWSDTNV